MEGYLHSLIHVHIQCTCMRERERERERERAVPMQYGMNYYNKIHQESFSE